MGVHVNEVHTDVTAGGAQGSGVPAGTGDRPADDERWLQAKSRAERLMRRVRAEGFSD